MSPSVRAPSLSRARRLAQEHVLGAGAVIGADVKIGAHCRIYPRVVVYPGTELGNNSSFTPEWCSGPTALAIVRDARAANISSFPQQGRLIIEDDVEIGANSPSIAAPSKKTRIERGVKIDNLVHLGHNVRVGRNVVIAAQTGVSGSSSIDANAVVGGQVALATTPTSANR